MSTHLDLDALADVLADGPAGADATHLASCPACRARLDELAAALPAVSSALAALPAPVPPAGLEERLLAAVADAARPGTADVLPMSSRRTRWLPALGAVAAAAVLVTGGILVAQQGTGSRTPNDSAAGAKTYAVNDSGTDYRGTPASLSAALPRLLAGGAVGTRALDAAAPMAESQKAESRKGASPAAGLSAASPDPLAELRTTAGLARCLASLTDPADEGLPLALDYASFEGTPALVVVLPSVKAGKVDVMVVPAGCAQADGQVLYFTRLPKP